MIQFIPQHAIDEGYPTTTPDLFCNKVDNSGTYENPTTCFEARDVGSEATVSTIVLIAEGVNKIHDLFYPVEVHSLSKAFMDFDEPVYPIPVGPSVFFFTIIAWFMTFYFTYFGRKILHKVIDKLDLYPDAIQFPDIPLYWLQQTKKEAELRREIRNTWAWLSKRYLLSPNDPLLSNIEQDLLQVTWHDFELGRNTQSLITCILRVNALFLKVRKAGSKKQFEIIRDRDLTKIPMDGDQVRRIFEDLGEEQETNENPQIPTVDSQMLQEIPAVAESYYGEPIPEILLEGLVPSTEESGVTLPESLKSATSRKSGKKVATGGSSKTSMKKKSQLAVSGGKKLKKRKARGSKKPNSGADANMDDTAAFTDQSMEEF